VSARHVAVVGAGASGTIQALHLLDAGIGRVTLVEREREPGRGTAYGTVRPEHLLNVPARRMIVWPDDPDQFARWCTERGGGPEEYAPRRRFGDYLSGLLAAASDRVAVVRGEAVAIAADGGCERVALADGRALAADAVVLALGNLRPAPVAGVLPSRLGSLHVDDPWFGDLADGLGAADTVLLIGTGLTAIDAALTLDALGFAGRILALSRRGLVPRASLKREPSPPPRADFPADCAGLLRAVRRRGEAIGWREAVHEVRQAVRLLWSRAPLAERRRFIRHLRPWWDVHRHRIAPAVAERIAALQAEGRLGFAAGRIRSAEADGDAAAVTWRPRGGGADRRLRVRRIVNCTGPELDIARAGEPLLDALLGAGRIRPDGCRLGIDVDPQCRALAAAGEPSGSLYAIGPMTRGAFWESIAVSDIAAQAGAVARRIAA
jgi:uncharacterized NAD(P)/FAD-binding protein YdhS